MSATLSPVASAGETRTAPWWLLPQQLSLDAPLVAAAWLWLFARSFSARFDLAECFAIAGAAWLIYALDHILDVRAGALYSSRHRFVLTHLTSFRIAIAAVFGITVALLPVLPRSAWHAGFAISLFVLVYLAAVHFGGAVVKRWWPKELAIGCVFAAASSIPVWQDPAPAWIAIVLFAALCTLNCTALDCWEWQSCLQVQRTPHAFTRVLCGRFQPLTVVVATASLCLYFDLGQPVFLAAALSASLMFVLGFLHRRFAIETTRVLADAALLTPLLFLR